LPSSSASGEAEYRASKLELESSSYDISSLNRTERGFFLDEGACCLEGLRMGFGEDETVLEEPSSNGPHKINNLFRSCSSN
jgi:hypothetical protein